uniref:Autophagy protein 5 n=1 Tax=Ditylum brightwellii TaxID=49249 RepID=A0A7S4R920_9STRA
MPPPLHKLVPRMTYLHIGLSEEVRKMYKFAPAMLFKGKSGVDGGAIRSKMEPPENLDVDSKSRSNSGVDGEDGKSSRVENSKTEKESTKERDGDNNDDNANHEDDDENSFPICWFEDVDTGIALRWHLFVGVLFDVLVRRRRRRNQRQSYNDHYTGTNDNGTKDTRNENDQQKKRKEEGAITSQPLDLPWKIRVHFTSYPTSQILQFDEHDSSTSSSTVLTTVQRFFNNSLKQSLSLQHGSPKVALNMTKANHETFWEALIRSNHDLYRQVNAGLQVAPAVAHLGDGNHMSTKELNEQGKGKEEKEDEHDKEEPNLDFVKVTRPWDHLKNVPVRLLVDSNPLIQKPVCVYSNDDAGELAEEKGINDSLNHRSLGDLLLEWVPNLFRRERRGDVNKESNNSTVVPMESVTWSIQGIQPPLSYPIVDLWQCLSHPDHFLYITIDTNTL